MIKLSVVDEEKMEALKKSRGHVIFIQLRKVPCSFLIGKVPWTANLRANAEGASIICEFPCITL